jgi:hypothetical protein
MYLVCMFALYKIFLFFFLLDFKGTWNLGPQWGSGCDGLWRGRAREQARICPHIAGQVVTHIALHFSFSRILHFYVYNY